MSNDELTEDEVVETRFSTSDVAMMAGVTYRQLDYWLRTGTIGFCEGVEQPGSGHPRNWTEDEVAIVCLAVNRWREAQEIVDSFRSGALWKEIAREHGC